MPKDKCGKLPILGVIRSQSSHWSGQLIRVPDKDKDVASCLQGYSPFINCIASVQPLMT